MAINMEINMAINMEINMEIKIAINILQWETKLILIKMRKINILLSKYIDPNQYRILRGLLIGDKIG